MKLGKKVLFLFYFGRASGGSNFHDAIYEWTRNSSEKKFFVTSSQIRHPYTTIRATIYEKVFWPENFPKTEYFPTKSDLVFFRALCCSLKYCLVFRHQKASMQKKFLFCRNGQNFEKSKKVQPNGVLMSKNNTVFYCLYYNPSYLGLTSRAVNPRQEQ